MKNIKKRKTDSQEENFVHQMVMKNHLISHSGYSRTNQTRFVIFMDDKFVIFIDSCYFIYLVSPNLFFPKSNVFFSERQKFRNIIQIQFGKIFNAFKKFPNWFQKSYFHFRKTFQWSYAFRKKFRNCHQNYQKSFWKFS